VRPKHIVLVDGLWVGHHPTYVKTFAKVLLDAGYRVSVLCPAPDEVLSEVGYSSVVDEQRLIACQFSDQMPKIIPFLPTRLCNPFMSLARWMRVSRALRAIRSFSGRPDLVFFAWLDSYVTGYLPVRFIGWLFPFYWTGLYFHPRHWRNAGRNGKPQQGWFALPEQFLVKSKWASSIAVLDAGIVDALRAELAGKPVVVLPDFTDEVLPSERCALVEEIQSKAKGRTIIGLLGGLARRKGLLTLIRIAKQSHEMPWCFVFAGVLLEETFTKEELIEVRTFFSTERENCFFFLRKIPDDAQFNAVFNVCDVIFAMYENFPHSSNLVTKAAIFGKNILVSCGGYMEEVVLKYELGEAVRAGDVEGAIRALHGLADAITSIGRWEHMQEYARSQSQGELRKAILMLVERSMPEVSLKQEV